MEQELFELLEDYALVRFDMVPVTDKQYRMILVEIKTELKLI